MKRTDASCLQAEAPLMLQARVESELRRSQAILVLLKKSVGPTPAVEIAENVEGFVAAVPFELCSGAYCNRA